MSNKLERRTQKRRLERTSAWADPGGILPVIDCRILDISETGAKVAAGVGVEFPEKFQLQIDAARILGSAEVIWRTRNEVGVRFLSRT